MRLSNEMEGAIMSRIKAALILSAVLLGGVASAPALAWHHGRVHFGVVIGAPFYAESKTYYPYVKECPGGWQRVTPQPAPGG